MSPILEAHSSVNNSGDILLADSRLSTAVRQSPHTELMSAAVALLGLMSVHGQEVKSSQSPAWNLHLLDSMRERLEQVAGPLDTREGFHGDVQFQIGPGSVSGGDSSVLFTREEMNLKYTVGSNPNDKWAGMTFFMEHIGDGVLNLSVDSSVNGVQSGQPFSYKVTSDVDQHNSRNLFGLIKGQFPIGITGGVWSDYTSLDGSRSFNVDEVGAGLVGFLPFEKFRLGILLAGTTDNARMDMKFKVRMAEDLVNFDGLIGSRFGWDGSSGWGASVGASLDLIQAGQRLLRGNHSDGTGEAQQVSDRKPFAKLGTGLAFSDQYWQDLKVTETFPIPGGSVTTTLNHPPELYFRPVFIEVGVKF